MSKPGDEWELIGRLGENLLAQAAKYQELKLSMVHREIQRMADDDGVTISWTRDKRNLFRRAWKKADEEEKESFTFQGNEYLVTYGRYLLEYLDQVLGK